MAKSRLREEESELLAGDGSIVYLGKAKSALYTSGMVFNTRMQVQHLTTLRMGYFDMEHGCGGLPHTFPWP